MIGRMYHGINEDRRTILSGTQRFQLSSEWKAALTHPAFRRADVRRERPLPTDSSLRPDALLARRRYERPGTRHWSGRMSIWLAASPQPPEPQGALYR